MEHDEEHVLGKVVLVQASEGEEDILHLHWYKRVPVRELRTIRYAPDCTTGTYVPYVPSVNLHD